MKYSYVWFVIGCVFFFSGVANGQLVSDNAFLQGRYLDAAIAPNGSWGSTVTVPVSFHKHIGGGGTGYVDPVLGTATDTSVDFSYDANHDGWTAGTPTGTPCCFYGPYFMPGTPFDGWSMQINGKRSDAYFTNGGPVSATNGFWNATPASSKLTGTVGAYNFVPGCPGVTQSFQTGTWTGTAGPGAGLTVVQTNRLDTGASWLVVNTIFTNTTATTMTGLYYFVTGDPDNDEVTTGGSFPTNNHITYQNDAIHRVLAWGRPPSLHQDAFSSLSTKDCRAKALIYTGWSPYPAEAATNTLDQIYAGTAGWLGTSYYALGATTLDQDIAYGLIFQLGDLPPGASTFVSYAWGFNDTTAVDSAFKQPQMNVNCFLAPNSYTISPCPLTTLPVRIENGYWGTTTWNWSPAIGLSSTTGTYNTINVLALPGTTTYTITPSDTASCNHFPPFFLTVITCFSATSNSPCIGDTLTLTAHGDSTGATYTWIGPGIGGPMLGSGQTINIFPSTWADTGIFYVIKTVGSTSDTTSTHVVIKPLPVVVATTNAPICSQTTLDLFANPDSLGETFTWTGPGGFTSGVQNPTIGTVPVSASGLYKVYTSWNGCIDSASVNVVIDSTPAIPAATSNSPVCSGNTLLLSSGDATTGVTYSWSGPPAFSSTLQNPNISPVTTASSGVYTVTAILGMCRSSNTTLVTINQTPPAPVLGSNAPICSGSALDLTATTTAGSTYSWVGPNGFISALQNPIINPATTLASGTYSVIATLAGCPSALSMIAVVVDSTPVAPVAGSNSPVCSGNTLSLTASDATEGVGFSWSGPNLFTSTLQDPSITPVTTAASGIYTVTAVLGICSSFSTTTVVINQTPIAPDLTSNSPVCSGNPLIFTASSTAGSTYGWTGPNGFVSGLQNPTINPATTLATGTYSVIATLNGCPSAMATIFVEVDSTPAAPVLTTNSPGTPSICEGDTLTFTATDVTAGVTYSWAGPNAFSSTLQDPIITNVTTAADGLYTVTVSNGGTCTNIAVISVSIAATPALTATSNSPVCTGSTDTLFLHAIAPAGSTFSWTGPYVFASGNPNPQRDTVILEYGGIYQVTATLNGCKATVNDTVVVVQTPLPPMVNWLTYCQYYLAAPLMAGGSNILWYPTDTAHGIGTSVPPLPPTARDTVMWFYVTQTVDGCISALDSIRVTVNPKPTVTITPADTAVCPHDTLVLTGHDADLVANYSWSPSMYLNNTNTSTVTVRPETDIHYTLVATNQYGCTDTAIAHVSVYPAAVIDLGDSVILYPGDTYQLNPLTNCSSFMWTPPGGLSDPYISNPVASPEISTKYVVYGVTSQGCSARDSINIAVSAQSLIALPNAFTPGTGPNSEFKIILNGIATLNYFRIWDRWGVLVFESTDISKGWDGTYKGTPQPVGVFIYQVEAVTSIGTRIEKHGNVTLLR